MNISLPDLRPAQSERAWVKALSAYRKPNRLRSSIELAITVVPLAALWALTWPAFPMVNGGVLFFIIPAAGFLVRLFMIQHDCGHGAFFANRQADDWIGRVLGVLTLTPYDYWRRTHAAHHAGAGNLDQRGMGDITTLTVAEYRGLSRWGKLRYRALSSPGRHVRCRTRLAVLPATAPAVRPDARPARRLGYRPWRPMSASRSLLPA